MKSVSSYLELHQLIANVRNLKKGFITNFYPEEFKINLWIINKELSFEETSETILFFHKCDGFITLLYCSTKVDTLNEALTKLDSNIVYIVDVISNTPTSPVIEIFYTNGFEKYNSLVRMSKINQTNDTLYQPNENIRNTDVLDIHEILELFATYFDKFVEQIPMNEELEQWIKQSRLIIYELESKIAGFLIYDLIGITLYLRYWFVRPEYRNLKVGSELIKVFLHRGIGTKRQLFWVIESNENAIIRYIHYGFIKEEMYDVIMIKK